MNISFNFTDHVIVITGGASGIGKDVAIQFAKRGAKVVVGDINEADALKVIDEIKQSSGEALFVRTDVTDTASAKNLIDTALNTYGSIHALVNVAGGADRRSGMPLTGTSVKDFDDTYALNVKGLYNTCVAVYDYFKDKGTGRIINFSSVVGHSTNPQIIHYSTAKAAGMRFTLNLAAELGPYHVTVNSICPGIVYTPLYDKGAAEMGEKWPELYGGKTGKEIVQMFAENVCAMKRPQTTEDVANAVMFLASDAAENITGQILDVAGGYKL